MLAIGQALMSGPSVILLHEPSAGLAPLLFAEVLTRVEQIAATGIAVLLVEQAAPQALRVASSLYVLRLGRIHKEPDVHTIDTEELLPTVVLRRVRRGAGDVRSRSDLNDRA